MVDWSIILFADIIKTENGTGTGRRTVTLPAPRSPLPAPRFFLKITHTDVKFSESKKVEKKVDSKAGLHSKLAIMSMHVAHTE